MRGALLCALMLVPAVAQAEETQCTRYGEFKGNASDYARVAAQTMLVGIEAELQPSVRQAGGRHHASPENGSSTGTPEVGTGIVVGFISQKRVFVDPCGVSSVQDTACKNAGVLVLTARHVLMTTDLNAASVNVYDPADTGNRYPAKIVAQIPDLDLAVLSVPMPISFVWTGFRKADAPIKPSGRLSMGSIRAGHVSTLSGSYEKTELAPIFRIVSAVSATYGDSGGALFDDEWNLIGVVTNAGENEARAVPGETIRLALSALPLSWTAFPTAAQVYEGDVAAKAAKDAKEKADKEEAEWGKSVERWVFGLGTQHYSATRPQVGWPTIGSAGLEIASPPMTHASAFGLAFVASFAGRAGYPESHFFAEVAGNVGLAGYVWKRRIFRIAGTWSPSVLTWGHFPNFALAAYELTADGGFGPIRLGAQIRAASPIGATPDFVQTMGYLTVLTE